MTRVTSGVVGSSWGLAASMCALVACGGALRRAPGAALGIPQNGAIEADVAAGYRQYGPMLERWGRWSDDPLYGVRWCPRVDPSTFVPYRSNGHWASAGQPTPTASNARTSGRASEGAPYWRSNDEGAWGDVTTHHGWWVHTDDGGPTVGRWCWIPGAEVTAARVVWREADGFVGWAPEPPAYDEDEDAGDDSDDRLAFSYELLGTLFDDLLDDALLGGQAAADASDATRSTRRGGVVSRHTGPGSAEVAQARKALTEYVAAHPVVATRTEIPSTPATGSKAASSALGEHEGPVVSTSKSPGVTSSRSHGEASSEELPPGMVLYEQMMRDPLAGSLGYGASPYLPIVGARASVGGTGAVASSTGSESHRRSSSSTPSSSHSSSHHGSSHSGHSSGRGR